MTVNTLYYLYRWDIYKYKEGPVIKITYSETSDILYRVCIEGNF